MNDLKLIESIEKQNVAKILIRNYGESCFDLAKVGDENTQAALTLTSTQILRFMYKLIEENDRLKSKEIK